ncbi:MAG TPA: hypothetical protein VMI54_19535 [Polyangiaceae bacterium]|nr:hypothetical protein [Polyangiaceae bacterium]
MRHASLIRGVALLGMMAGCTPLVTVAKGDGGAGAADESAATGGAGGSTGRFGGAVAGYNSGPGEVVGADSGGADTGSGSGGSDSGGGLAGGSFGVAGLGSNPPVEQPPPYTPTDCPCSRSFGSPLAGGCPVGTDASSSAFIGPEGGTVTVQTVSGTSSAQLFPNSLTDSIRISLTELNSPTPDGFIDYSPIYQVGPPGVDLPNGGVITLPYSNSIAKINPALAIYTADSLDGPWTKLDDTYPDAGFDMATLLRTGFFFMGYPSTGDDCLVNGEAPASWPTNATFSSCPCSRNDPTPSMWCPRGADTSTTTTLGPDGGTATLDGTPDTLGVPFRIDIPAGAISVPTQVTLIELSAPTPDGYTDFSPIYEIDPQGLALAQAGSIQINETNVANGKVSENDLSIYTADSVGGPWTKLSGDAPNAGFHTAPLLGTGFFFIGRPASDDAGCE